MSKIIKLHATRKRVKDQVKRMKNFLKSGNRVITYKQAQVRLENLQKLWSTYNEVQTEIEEHEAEKNSGITWYFKEDKDRKDFEEAYYKIIDEICEIIAPAQAAAVSNPEEVVVVVQQDVQPEAGLQGDIDIKLSTLKLPIFSGEYNQWMLFKDVFQSLIHDNCKLSNVQKFQYLRSMLKDKALQVISSLSESAENYFIAWNVLKGYYGNKKLLINNHLSALLKFPIVTKDKHMELKQFIVHLRKHLKALQILGQPVDQWDTLIIFLAKSKLDSQTQQAWEKEVGQEVDHMPTAEEFLKFLDGKCHTLEMLDSNVNCNKLTLKNTPDKKMDKLNLSVQNCITAVKRK